MSKKEFIKLSAKIKKYIKEIAHAPAQKSTAWYALKQKTIGGSEIATVLGLNPFKSNRALIAEKSNVASSAFDGNIATRWGNIFEHVTKMWTENILQMDEEIQEAGSIEGVIERQRYSPDGLGVVKLLNGDALLEYFIVLFEFKSPLRSIPEGKIPKHYVPQVQTGMLTIPIVDVSIFVNNCYRKCAMKDIGFNLNYDKVFHNGDVKKIKKRQPVNEVLACGMLCFYQTIDNYENAVKACGYDSDSDSGSESDINQYLDEQEREEFKFVNLDDEENKVADIVESTTENSYKTLSTSDHDIEILLNSRESPIDLGSAKHHIIDRVFELYEEKRIGVMYYPIILNPEAVNNLSFIELHKKIRDIEAIKPKKILAAQYNLFTSQCEDKEWLPLGFLPWKLIKSDIICEDRDDLWREKIEPKVKETLAVIDAIVNSGDPAAKYDELFPPKEPIVMNEDDFADMINDVVDTAEDSDFDS